MQLCSLIFGESRSVPSGLISVTFYVLGSVWVGFSLWDYRGNIGGTASSWSPVPHADSWLWPFFTPGKWGMGENEAATPFWDTWNFGGDPSGDGGPEALRCAGLDGEGVGGPWVQTHKEVVGFIPQLEHLPPLAGEVGTRVQGANSLVVDLHKRRASKPINTRLRSWTALRWRDLRGGKEEACGFGQWVPMLLSTLQVTQPRNKPLWALCTTAAPQKHNHATDMLFSFLVVTLKYK